MEDWQQEIIRRIAQNQQEIVSRGLSPEGGLFRQKEKQIEEEENNRLKDLQQKLLQYQWFQQLQQQGDNTKSLKRNTLEKAQQIFPLLPYAKEGISLLSTLSKGVGLTPWGLPLLVGGFLFKKPLKKFFRKLRGR